MQITTTGIFGGLGDGKTICATYLSNKFHNEKPNELIYSNYTLPFAKYISNPQDLMHISNCECFYDDIIPTYDSRHSTQNILETQILNFLRKKGIKLTYTAQIEGAVDLRLRAITDVFVITKVVEFPKFHIIVEDKNYRKIDEYYREYGEDVIKLYNTCEIVRRKISLDELMRLKEEIGKGKLEFAELIKAKYSFKLGIGTTIYTLLKNKKIDTLKEFIFSYGYEIID